MKEVEGFIINEISYGETSKIISVFAKDKVYGIMAKGAKSIKNSNRYATTKFTYGRFIIIEKQDKLSILKEASVIEDFTNIKTDLTLISYLNYIVELTSQVLKQTEKIESLYNLFMSLIKKLNSKLNPKILTNIYELKLLDYLGVGINFDSCSVCGTTHNIITIDGDVGGYVCKECYREGPIYDDKTIKMLRMYYLIDIDSIKEFKINDSIINNIDNFINTYYDRYTGLYVYSKKFLKDILEM